MRKSIYITSKNRYIFLGSDSVEQLFIAHSKDGAAFDIIIRFKGHDDTILGTYMDKNIAISAITGVNDFLLNEMSTTYMMPMEFQ